MEDIKDKDYKFDIGCIISGHDIYHGNKNAVIFNDDEFRRFVDNAAEMGKAAVETATIPQLREKLGKDISDEEIKKVAYRYGFIGVTQRIQNVYPLYDFDVLKDFRKAILQGFMAELEANLTPIEDVSDAAKLFIADEMQKCYSMRIAVEAFLKSPSERVKRAKAVSIINKYIDFLSKAVPPKEEAAKEEKTFRDRFLCDEDKKDKVMAELRTDVSTTKKFGLLVQALIDIGFLSILSNVGGGKKGLHEAFCKEFGDKNIYTYPSFSDILATKGYTDDENFIIKSYREKYEAL